MSCSSPTRPDESTESYLACADGAALYYCVAGAGDPVVLIHGLGLDASMWDLQWPALRREFRAIRYDIRGFGRSTLPAGPYTHVEDLLALLHFLKARPAHVVGLSMGGRVALRFALEHPRDTKSLTLIDSALEGFSWSEEWTRRMAAILAAARNGDVAVAKQLWLTHELFAPAQRNPPIADALAAMVERYSAWHFQCADPARKPNSPAIKALPTIACPTMVIVGELDLPDFKLIAQILAAEIPRATLHIIQGAGHMANMEAPCRLNDLLLAHLRASSGENRDPAD